MRHMRPSHDSLSIIDYPLVSVTFSRALARGGTGSHGCRIALASLALSRRSLIIHGAGYPGHGLLFNPEALLVVGLHVHEFLRPCADVIIQE